jgi:hypothetical protein
MLVGALVIMTALKAERLAVTVGNQVSVHKELSRQFREDVSRAQSAPEQLGGAKSGPESLILQMPGKSVVVYRFEKNALERVERADNQKETLRQIPVGPGGTSVEFIRPKAGEGLITMRLIETPERGLPRQSEISAALGRSLK